MSWYGYYNDLPGERDNDWDTAPPDEVIEAMTKDTYKKGPGRADNRPGREKIHKPILSQRSVFK